MQCSNHRHLVVFTIDYGVCVYVSVLEPVCFCMCLGVCVFLCVSEVGKMMIAYFH